MQNINEIIPPEYQKRAFLNGSGTKRRAMRSIDQYSEDPNEGRGHGVPTEPEPEKIVTHQAFVKSVWADMNERMGVTPSDFELILKNPTLSPVKIDIANKGKIQQIISILITPGNKGVWMEGRTGRGKTWTMESIIRVNNKYKTLGCTNVRHIDSTKYYDISLELEKSQRLHEIDRSIKVSTFVDDFLYRGISTIDIYAKPKNIAELIIERMHYMQLRGHKQFATSNFSISDCAANGIFPATISRMRGMFHVIKWEGDQDFREG